MHEGPYCMIVDLHAVLGQIMDQTPKREVTLRTFKKPVSVRAA